MVSICFIIGDVYLDSLVRVVSAKCFRKVMVLIRALQRTYRVCVCVCVHKDREGGMQEGEGEIRTRGERDWFILRN